MEPGSPARRGRLSAAVAEPDTERRPWAVANLPPGQSRAALRAVSLALSGPVCHILPRPQRPDTRRLLCLRRWAAPSPLPTAELPAPLARSPWQTQSRPRCGVPSCPRVVPVLTLNPRRGTQLPATALPNRTVHASPAPGDLEPSQPAPLGDPRFPACPSCPQSIFRIQPPSPFVQRCATL